MKKNIQNIVFQQCQEPQTPYKMACLSYSPSPEGGKRLSKSPQTKTFTTNQGMCVEHWLNFELEWVGRLSEIEFCLFPVTEHKTRKFVYFVLVFFCSCLSIQLYMKWKSCRSEAEYEKVFFFSWGGSNRDKCANSNKWLIPRLGEDCY